MEGIVLRETVTAPPEEGRVENLVFRFVHSGALSSTERALRAFSVSRLKYSVYKDFIDGFNGLHQEGRGPAGIFSRQIVPRVRAGQRPRGTKTMCPWF